MQLGTDRLFRSRAVLADPQHPQPRGGSFSSAGGPDEGAASGHQTRSGPQGPRWATVGLALGSRFKLGVDSRSLFQDQLPLVTPFLPLTEELNISKALQRVLENLEYSLENCAAEMEANCTRQDLRVFFEVHQFKEKYRSACNGTEDRSDSFPMERCRGVYPAANGAPSSSEPLPTTCTCPTTTTASAPTVSDSAPTVSDSAPTASDSAPTASDSASTACNSTPTASSRTPTASDSIQNSSSIREKSWSPACHSETVLLLTSVLLNVFLVVTVIYLLSRRRHPVSHETTQPEETPLQNSTL